MRRRTSSKHSQGRSTAVDGKPSPTSQGSSQGRAGLSRRAWVGVAFGGAPWMDGATKDRYDVIAFTRSRETDVYAVR